MYKIYFTSPQIYWFFREDFPHTTLTEMDVNELNTPDMCQFEKHLFSFIKNPGPWAHVMTPLKWEYIMKLARYVFELGDERKNV